MAHTYATPVARLLLLLPTATYRAADFLTAARALGAEVVVASERLLVSLGDNQLTLPLRRRYLGFLFARGKTPGQVEHALRAAHARLEIDIVASPAAEPAAARG
jgi:hypothetical protein